MPELPEVETTRRKIAPLVVGKIISCIRGEGKNPIDSHKYPHTKQAHGKQIEALGRRGKYLIFSLSGGLELLVHLGMTGGFRLEPTPHTRLTFELDGGQALYFHDPRRFGKVAVVEAGEYSAFPTLEKMGPEPLSEDFSLAVFAEQATRAGAVKPWLLSQKPVSGVGNIYADEALWQAEIHPLQTRLTLSEAKRLHTAIQEIMHRAVEAGGSTLGTGKGNYRQHDGQAGSYQHAHEVYGSAGQPCSRCGTPISKSVVSGRGTHFCPQCQVLRG